jgi:hypothetical protein
LLSEVALDDVRNKGAEGLGEDADHVLLARLEKLVTRALEHHEIERSKRS